jgi:predicted DNA-binding transcriptional regulator AlpA
MTRDNFGHGHGDARRLAMGDGGAIERTSLRREEIPGFLGISITTLDRMIKAGEFPRASQYARTVPLWSIDMIRAWARGDWRPGSGPQAKPTRKGGRPPKKARAGA